MRAVALVLASAQLLHVAAGPGRTQPRGMPPPRRPSNGGATR
jgi:hypothetical protein